MVFEDKTSFEEAYVVVTFCETFGVVM